MTLAHWLASRPDPFGPNLTLSPRSKSDLGWFCTIWSGMSVEECNWVWKWETGSRPVTPCQKPGPMIPAHQLASRPYAFGQTLTRPTISDLGQFCTVWSMPSWKNRIESDAGSWSGILDSGCMLAMMAITGRDRNTSRSDPACLLGSWLLVPRGGNNGQVLGRCVAGLRSLAPGSRGLYKACQGSRGWQATAPQRERWGQAWNFFFFYHVFIQVLYLHL